MKRVRDLVIEMPKSPLPAGAAVKGGSYPFFVSGPSPLRIDQALAHNQAVILSTGGNAAVHYCTEHYSYSTDAWALQPIESKIDGRFLYYFLLSQIERIAVLGFQGSGLKHLRKDFVRDYLVPSVERIEQSKIAEILTTVDRAIEQTETLIAKQQRIKTGLMHDLLTRGIDEHGNLRSESTHEFKDSPLGRIPVEWQCDVGARFFDLRAGIPVSRLMRSQDGNALFLKVDDFNDPANANGLIRSEYTFVCTPILESRLLQPGTIVFPKRGAAIFVNRVELLKRTGTLDPNLMGLIPKARVRPEFMRLVLLHRNLGTICDNSGIPQINNKHLYPLLFMMPGYEEQREIVTRVMKSEGLLFASTESVQKLQRLRTGMMQDLLTGNRRVTALLKPSPEEGDS